MVPTNLLWLRACRLLGLHCPLLPWWSTGCWFSNDIDSQRDNRHQHPIVCKTWRLSVRDDGTEAAARWRRPRIFGGDGRPKKVSKYYWYLSALQMMLVHIDAR